MTDIVAFIDSNIPPHQDYFVRYWKNDDAPLFTLPDGSTIPFYDCSKFREIPRDELTQEICEYAVKRNVRGLDYVPDSLKNDALVLEPIKQPKCISELRCVPHRFFFKKEIWTAYLEYDLDTYGYFPIEAKTRETDAYLKLDLSE